MSGKNRRNGRQQTTSRKPTDPPSKDAFPSLGTENVSAPVAGGAWKEKLVIPETKGGASQRSTNDTQDSVGSGKWADDDNWGEFHNQADVDCKTVSNESEVSSRPVVKSEWTVGGTSDLAGTGTVRLLTTPSGREKLRYIRPYQGRKPFYVERQQKLRQQWEEEERLRREEEEDCDDPDGPWIYQPAHFELGLNINALVQEIHFNTIDTIELVDVERTNVFTDYEMMPVAMALRHNTSVETLIIRCLPCTDYSLVPLLESLCHHPNLRKLEISALDGKSTSTGKALVKLVTQNPNIVDILVTECHFLSELQQEAIDTAAQYNLLRIPELQRTQIQKQQLAILEGGCHPMSAAGKCGAPDPADLTEYPREVRRIIRGGGKPPICGEHMEKVTNMIIPKKRVPTAIRDREGGTDDGELPPPPAYQAEVPEERQYKPPGCRFGNRCLLQHPTPSVSKGSKPKDLINVPVNSRPEIFLDPKENKVIKADSSPSGVVGDGVEKEAPYTLPPELVQRVENKRLLEAENKLKRDAERVPEKRESLTTTDTETIVTLLPILVGVMCIGGVVLALKK